ncbi:mini-circle putative transposase for IS117 [Rhizocola hellebori]|uniref:Mini-circle putative transposase for IS117 n=1 Tax=Rhizocola hellebori TaxID=1392758 RepID=A0A8J3Q3K8_9ACTN|nr:IS110 family transposase [Rhizocola hellebori]GIH02852.1 mini-circle putative transposase for IS117 [Rhizocola hellebori]
MGARWCGIDWSESRHDVVLVDEHGRAVVRVKITEDPAGVAHLLGILTGAVQAGEDPVPVAIETPHGLLVAALRSAGVTVYAINPLAVARYRQRHSMAGRKSDYTDALTLANILRTDAHQFRPMPADSEEALALTVLARAHQDAVWRRTRSVRELRSVLRLYFPGFLEAFGPRLAHLYAPDARTVLALAPTPAHAAALTQPVVEQRLRRAGRSRNVAARAAAVVRVFVQPRLRQPREVENAYAERALCSLATLDAECDSVAHLDRKVVAAFTRHPDYRIVASFPGLGRILGARVLAEIGDDPTRFASPRNLKAFAGSAPITRASGKTVTIVHRYIKNRRLAAAGYQWATTAAMTYPPARLHYRQRREHGDTHAAALRHLFSKMLGQLHHCLQHRETYVPDKAWPPARSPPPQREQSDSTHR